MSKAERQDEWTESDRQAVDEVRALTNALKQKLEEIAAKNNSVGSAGIGRAIRNCDRIADELIQWADHRTLFDRDRHKQ